MFMIQATACLATQHSAWQQKLREAQNKSAQHLVTFAECRYECHYAECHFDECHYAECHFDECRYAECHFDGVSLS
jgi:hypothetical protein